MGLHNAEFHRILEHFEASCHAFSLSDMYFEAFTLRTTLRTTQSLNDIYCLKKINTVLITPISLCLSDPPRFRSWLRR